MYRYRFTFLKTQDILPVAVWGLFVILETENSGFLFLIKKMIVKVVSSQLLLYLCKMESSVPVLPLALQGARGKSGQCRAPRFRKQKLLVTVGVDRRK